MSEIVDDVLVYVGLCYGFVVFLVGLKVVLDCGEFFVIIVKFCDVVVVYVYV